MEIIHTAAEAVEIIMAGRTLINDFLRMWKHHDGRDGVQSPADVHASIARYVVVDRQGRALSISVDDRFFLARASRGVTALQFPDAESARFALEQIEDQRPEDAPMAVRTLAEYMMSVARYEASQGRDEFDGSVVNDADVAFIEDSGDDSVEDGCPVPFESLQDSEATSLAEGDAPRG
jgi:hypothetical protein